MTHPALPTHDQFVDWDSEYFDEDQNFDIMVTKAFQAGADWQLERDVEYWTIVLNRMTILHLCSPRAANSFIEEFKKAMRPQEDNQ